MDNYTTTSDSKNIFDKIITLSQKDKEIEYGIIDGSNTIVFIKAGREGSCCGDKNKYVKIGRSLNEKHGCSIIASSNPLGYQTDFSADMDFIKEYTKEHNLENY